MEEKVGREEEKKKEEGRKQMKDIVQEISTPFEFNHNFIRD